MTHDDLRERIAGQREGLILGDGLFLCSQCVGGLNVGLLAAGGCNEVDFPRDRSDPSFGIFLIAIDDADVNGAFTDHQLIENDVLHDMRHFLLTETDTGISQSNILAVILVGVYFSYIGKFENELTQLAEPTEEEIRQMREKIEEAQKEKSRAYHRNYSKEYRAKNLEKRREYERIKAREYRAKRKAQAAALPVS